MRVCYSAVQALVIPLEVDLLLLGFNEDGGYNYLLEQRDLEDVSHMLARAGRGEGWEREGLEQRDFEDVSTKKKGGRGKVKGRGC